MLYVFWFTPPKLFNNSGFTFCYYDLGSLLPAADCFYAGWAGWELAPAAYQKGCFKPEGGAWSII